MAIKTAEVAKFLKTCVEPLPDPIYGNRFRAAAHLIDGTYLPCVVFQSKKKQLELFERRIKQLENDSSQKHQVIASFIASPSTVSTYNLESVESSRYAWPVELLNTIHGETAMGWTAFVAKMRDGSLHSYGTTFYYEFFDLPGSYTYKDIERIYSGMIYVAGEGILPYSSERTRQIRVLRERPFFACYLEELD